MANPVVIGEFRFVTNSSFVNSHVITIPSRFYPAIKEYGVWDATPAVITFGGGAPMKGSFRSSVRAGGRYYQIKIGKLGMAEEVSQLRMYQVLTVRVSKTEGAWQVDLNERSP